MNEVVGTTEYLRFVMALALVIGLIGLIAYLMRRYGLRLVAPQGKRDKRRLSIQEVLPLDARHRVILIRQDNQEHLILVGANDSRVIQSGMEIADWAENEFKGGQGMATASDNMGIPRDNGAGKAPASPLAGLSFRSLLQRDRNERRGSEDS